jgi:hypothetical protein
LDMADRNEPSWSRGVSARERVVRFWDDHVAAWLDGEDPMPDPLPRWFASYSGQGEGRVTRQGFVEPYQGDLIGEVVTPRVVVLGLNPGIFVPGVQHRQGLFADEIRAIGSYSRWINTHPYDRDPWVALRGPNRYYRARLSFTRNWMRDPAASYGDLLMFELYPWHSTSITGIMRCPPDIVDQFIWQPLSELPIDPLFAFGRPWEAVANALNLPLVDALGLGGRRYGSQVSSRAVRVFALPSGQRLVIEWHRGGAGPPRSTEVDRLRDALG